MVNGSSAMHLFSHLPLGFTAAGISGEKDLSLVTKPRRNVIIWQKLCGYGVGGVMRDGFFCSSLYREILSLSM